MEQARVVTLAPNTGVSVVSFEDAFGDYSEARGGRRAKRQERKKQRLIEKGERKDIRQSNRAKKQSNRQAIRAQRQEAKQVRKDVKKEHRVNRRALGREESLPEEIVDQNEVMPNEQEGYSQDAVNNETQSIQQESEQGGEQVGWGDSGGNQEQQGGGYQEQGGEQVGWGDEGMSGDGETEEEGGYEEESGDGGEYGEDESGFIDESNADGSNKRHAQALKATHQLELAKFKLFATERKKAKQQVLNQPTGEQDKQIAILKRQIQILQAKLDGMGMSSDFSGKASAHARNNIRESILMKRRGGNGGSERTVVQSDLEPRIKPNNIVVPSQSNTDGQGTGLTGLDNMNDFDAPEKTEIKLGADGGKVASVASKINVKNVVIGVAIGAVIIYALKKFKVI